MFSHSESERIRLTALAQALLAAFAKPEADLKPITDNWPFTLTVSDQHFLKTCPFPISPA